MKPLRFIGDSLKRLRDLPAKLGKMWDINSIKFNEANSPTTSNR